jgi:glyoxylase-like metal-dependent hydrolase (beta-lactamase superfamily II)
MVKIIDIQFLGVKSAIACFLIKSSKGLVMIETGPSTSYKIISQELNNLGYNIKDVKHVFITHIHLDHSGGAWKFAENGAKIYVHPNGAKHLKNPQKLIESATKIYGNKMDFLWGKIKKIDKKKIQTVEHKEKIIIGDTIIKSLHTPGHAEHHIAWKINDEIFAGDVAGAKIFDGPVLPACPPPEIDLEKWENSIDIIIKENPKCLYLTHFGKTKDVDNHLKDLKKILWDWAKWIKKNNDKFDDVDTLTEKFKNYVNNFLKNLNLSENLINQYYTANPPYMSVSGLLRYWNKKNKH